MNRIDILSLNMDSDTITVKQTITLDLTFKDFKKALKNKKYSNEQLDQLWKALKKQPNLGSLIALYGSMSDKDEADELFEKPLKKEIKTIIASCLETALEDD